MGLLDTLFSVLGRSTDGDVANQYGPFNPPPRDRVDRDRRAGIIAEHYDEVPEQQAVELASILQSEMDGSTYSPGDIRHRFADVGELDSTRAREIANVEITSIQLEESVQRYLSRDFETDVEWLLPGDGDVHPVCEATAAEVEERGGVSVAELHTILKQQAFTYEDQGGTPERADHWVFHEGNCRCAITPPG